MNNILPLEVKNISKSFGDHVVLDDISLSLQTGEIFGLVGLNGIGKTTLIKIILDLINADRGEVLLSKCDHKDFNSRKNLAYLPEKFYPPQFLTGMEFIELSLNLMDMNVNIDNIKEICEILDFDFNNLTKKISKYSKGMGQKLGLMSVFLSEAPLLILDEPMSGLDPSARIELKKLFRSYRAKGKTIFFSSHILADIEELCDEIAIIHNTKILFKGSPNSCKTEQNAQNLDEAFLKIAGI